jgi:hypothetical protein
MKNFQKRLKKEAGIENGVKFSIPARKGKYKRLCVLSFVLYKSKCGAKV